MKKDNEFELAVRAEMTKIKLGTPLIYSDKLSGFVISWKLFLGKQCFVISFSGKSDRFITFEEAYSYVSFRLIHVGSPPSYITNEYGLTEREMNVLYHAALGYNAEEAAKLLSISTSTVSKHLENVKGILKSRNTVHSVFIVFGIKSK